MFRICLVLITAFGLSTGVYAQDCGPDYPEDLECLAGGAYQRTVDVLGITKAIVITYQMPKDELHEAFRSLLANSDWNSSGWREGNEAEGTRYRVSLSKENRKIGIAIYGTGDTSVLQVSIILVSDSPKGDD